MSKLKPKYIDWLLFASPIAVVILSLVLEEIYRLAPCPLCIFQRMLYMVAALVAGIALFTKTNEILKVCLGLNLALVTITGFGLSIYQGALELFPGKLAACNYANPGLIETIVELAGAQMPYLFLATGFCGSRSWTLLGLTPANLSTIVFAVLSCLVLVRYYPITAKLIRGK